MLIDAANTLSDKQPLTAAAISQKVIDLGSEYPLSGNSNGSHDMEIVLSVSKTFAPTTSNLTIQIRTSSTKDASGRLVNPVVLNSTGVILGTALKAGIRLPVSIRVPPEAKRYVDLNYVPSANFTAGEISAALAVTARTI